VAYDYRNIFEGVALFSVMGLFSGFYFGFVFSLVKRFYSCRDVLMLCYIVTSLVAIFFLANDFFRMNVGLWEGWLALFFCFIYAFYLYCTARRGGAMRFLVRKH